MAQPTSSQTMVVHPSFENWVALSDEGLSQFDGPYCISSGKWRDSSSVSTTGSFPDTCNLRRSNGKKTMCLLSFVCLVSLGALSLTMLLIFGQINAAGKCSCGTARGKKRFIVIIQSLFGVCNTPGILRNYTNEAISVKVCSLIINLICMFRPNLAGRQIVRYLTGTTLFSILFK